MCCKVCLCGQNSVRCDHSNGTSLNGNICFGSLSSLQKGNLLSVCVGYFGASLLDETLFRFGSWGKTRAEKGVLLSYVTLVHSSSRQDLFPYEWHYPIARTAKNISLKWNNALLIRLGRNYGTDRPINHRWHYPHFTVARKTCVYSELIERDIVEL